MAISKVCDAGASLSPSKQRMLLSSTVFLVVGLIIYANIFTLLTVMLTLALAWYGLDLIRQHTMEKIDPAGKYVFITSCDSGEYLPQIMIANSLKYPKQNKKKTRKWIFFLLILAFKSLKLFLILVVMFLLLGNIPTLKEEKKKTI